MVARSTTRRVSTTATSLVGVAVDFDGNFYFIDGLGHLRVIYMAGTNVKAALAANGIASPTVGTSYALIGPPTSYSGSVLESLLQLCSRGDLSRLDLDAAERCDSADQPGSGGQYLHRRSSSGSLLRHLYGLCASARWRKHSGLVQRVGCRRWLPDRAVAAWRCESCDLGCGQQHWRFVHSGSTA